MREILFRGKSVEDNKWVYGFVDNTTVYDASGNYIATIINEKTEKPFVGEWYEIDPETVGRYTGLKDKNGTKIFEGDIIRVKSFDYDYEYTTKVYCSCHTLCVDIYGQDYDFTSIGFADDIWDDENCEVKVIGNIHDNPELLEA